MNNLFEISPEEKDRIRQLHESYKNVHGTTSLLTEQADRTIKGTTHDNKTKELLLGTQIFVTERPDHETTSGRQGEFELTGIKVGETVTMRYDKKYEDLVLDSEKIDNSPGIVQFFMTPKTKPIEINPPTEKGCLDPSAKNFDQEKFENHELLDCAGQDQRASRPDDSEAGFTWHLDIPNQDNSCCEYHIGCTDENAKNYWEKDPELSALAPVIFKKAEFDDATIKALEDFGVVASEGENTVIPKQIKGCKNNKCCEYHIEGCLDAEALNYNPKATKPCLDENEDGKPDCCKYPKGQRSIETIKKNFQTYYNDNLIGQTINAYTTIEGRNAQEIDELYGNYKIDNVIPTRLSKGDKTYGYSIPLQPDTEALRRKIQKCSTITREKRKIKCKKEVEELRKATASLVVKFDETFLTTLQSIINVRDTLKVDEIAKLYIRPRGSKKMGKEVYVGPKDFLTDEVQNLISFLKAYNKELGKVPGTSM